MTRHSEKRQMDHVVSVRFDDAQLAGVQALADADGVPLSTWIRSAALRESIRRQHAGASASGLQIKGWGCGHLTVYGPAGALGKPTAWCGCEMQPVYERAA